MISLSGVVPTEIFFIPFPKRTARDPAFPFQISLSRIKEVSSTAWLELLDNCNKEWSIDFKFEHYSMFSRLCRCTPSKPLPQIAKSL